MRLYEIKFINPGILSLDNIESYSTFNNLDKLNEYLMDCLIQDGSLYYYKYIIIDIDTNAKHHSKFVDYIKTSERNIKLIELI